MLTHGPAPEQSLTDLLCTRCGLCCDGSLFADVELAGRREAAALEVMGLEIEDGEEDRPLMALPCRALRGTRCSVYAHRPQCCRTFECRLLQDVRRGTVEAERAAALIAEARGRIGRVKALLAGLGHRGGRLPLAERCAEALAEAPGSDREAIRKLKTEMSGVERMIRTTFLGEPGTRT